MIPNKILSALKTLYKIISDKQILWILTGSTSLVIQGVPIKINPDIDILTNKEGSKKIDKLLKEFCIQRPKYSTTDKYRSYFGIYQINDVKIEVMGEFQYKLKDGSWSQINHLNKNSIKEFEGMKLPILELVQELKEYENMGRHEKADKIKEFLRK